METSSNFQVPDRSGVLESPGSLEYAFESSDGHFPQDCIAVNRCFPILEDIGQMHRFKRQPSPTPSQSTPSGLQTEDRNKPFSVETTKHPQKDELTLDQRETETERVLSP